MDLHLGQTCDILFVLLSGLDDRGIFPEESPSSAGQDAG